MRSSSPETYERYGEEKITWIKSRYCWKEERNQCLYAAEMSVSNGDCWSHIKYSPPKIKSKQKIWGSSYSSLYTELLFCNFIIFQSGGFCSPLFQFHSVLSPLFQKGAICQFGHFCGCCFLNWASQKAQWWRIRLQLWNGIKHFIFLLYLLLCISHYVFSNFLVNQTLTSTILTWASPVVQWWGTACKSGATGNMGLIPGSGGPPGGGHGNHSSTLAWRIPGTEEPGGLQSMGSERVGLDWSDLAHTHSSLLKVLFTHLSYITNIYVVQGFGSERV